jgi:hypothetical protein
MPLFGFTRHGVTRADKNLLRVAVASGNAVADEDREARLGDVSDMTPRCAGVQE